MGCDIHMVLEYHHTDRNRWVGINDFTSISPSGALVAYVDGARQPIRGFWIARDRNYRFFGELAGVRYDGSVPREPNGLPDDISDLALLRIDEWGSDGHSHSHLSLMDFLDRWFIAHGQAAEAVTAKLEANGRCPKLYRDKVYELFGEDLSDEYTDDPLSFYRVVFWFDN